MPPGFDGHNRAPMILIDDISGASAGEQGCPKGKHEGILAPPGPPSSGMGSSMGFPNLLMADRTAKSASASTNLKIPRGSENGRPKSPSNLGAWDLYVQYIVGQRATRSPKANGRRRALKERLDAPMWQECTRFMLMAPKPTSSSWYRLQTPRARPPEEGTGQICRRTTGGHGPPKFIGNSSRTCSPQGLIRR